MAEGGACATADRSFDGAAKGFPTTTGRVTGQSREVEIWFTWDGGHFYLVAERETANWVRNIQSQPQVKVRVGDAEFNAIARVVRQ